MGAYVTDKTEIFLALLQAADAVSVDDGALLTEVQIEPLTGDPDNQVVCFSWTDGECDYQDILTEGGIAAGEFQEDGRFVVGNYEGEPTTIRFFAIEPLSRKTGKPAATQFFAELLDSVESLTGIADEYGARTLADLMYLQNAILSGGFIESYSDESSVVEVVSVLSSAAQWLRCIQSSSHTI